MSHRDLVFFRLNDGNGVHKVKPDPRDARIDALEIRRLFYDQRTEFSEIVEQYTPLGWSPRRIRDVIFYRTYRCLLPVDLELAPHSGWNAIRRSSMLPIEEAAEWYGD